jgi:Proton-conducting membrane transporter/NADH-Ubiquinone oxidoreductase (complex I), chain 5 N-terminus/LAGLIDADG endonuclease
MYISIVFLPFLAAILSGFFGRALGVKGVHIINVTCLLITTFLSFIAFYEVILCNSPVSIELFSWINLEYLKVSWSFYFDELTVGMLIPVLIVSLLVHLYSVGYMGEDPHQQRFFSYISLFTGLMLVLVTGNNFLVMFLGWEGVGICSYLLVHFWYTRIAAVKSGMNAMFTNRVGDYFLTIGFFAIFFTFGTLDYATVFSLAPYININVITFISILLLLGAAAKSAQLTLHIWLPMAMEGPTPVSALIHAATMVRFCHKLIQINLFYRYMLEKPYIKFIHILIYLNKMYKKILCLVNIFIRGVNQQETFLNENSVMKKDSSETIRDIIYNFNNYLNLKPQHKNKVDISFLEWFVGFTEGDGSFVIQRTKNKVSFDITQSMNNVQILYYIKKELGFGKVLIRSEEKRNIGVFYVTGEENFMRLITIFNGNFSTLHKKEQFKEWLNVFNDQYKRNILFIDNLVQPSLKTAWLSGFADAEGCFTGRVKKCKTYKLKQGPHLTFSISQKELYIIKELRKIIINEETGFKNIKFDKSWKGWVFHISSFIKLKILRNYFSKYKLKTKKYLAYKKWSQIHDMVLNKKHLTLIGLSEINSLVKKINDYNYKLKI